MLESTNPYMLECLRLAEIALLNGNPPVGAIVVHDGIVIGRGIESGKSTGDITNHAEILAVRDALAKGHALLLPESEMYTTHEPCIMCAYFLRHHKIKHIIYGISVPYIGGHTSPFNLLETKHFPKWGNKPRITPNVCAAACEDLNRRYAALTHR